MQSWEKKLFVSIFCFSLLAGAYVLAASPKEENLQIPPKIGPKYLRYDEKENITYLSVCPGQQWKDDPFKGLKQVSVKSDNPKIAAGSFLKSPEQDSVVLSIEGKSLGTTKIFFDLEVPQLSSKTTSIFEVSVIADCGGVGPPAQPPPPPAESEAPWNWPFPKFKEYNYSTGGAPNCLLPDGDLSPTGDIALVGFWKISPSAYLLKSVPEDKWTQWFDWPKGKMGVRKIVSSNKKVVKASYNAKDAKFVISPLSVGHAKIAVEFAILPPKFNKAKQKIKWQEIKFLVEVIPENPKPTPACQPTEPFTPEPIVDTCEENKRYMNEEPLKFTVPAPVTLTTDEQALADRIFQMIKNTWYALPLRCTKDEVITRQARKAARAFYKTPLRNNEIYAACGDCAKDVEGEIFAALKDEELSCIKITKVGRNPILNTALHTATAIGPACTEVNDDWIVVDTWRKTGNVPLLQEFLGHFHRVFDFAEWRSENFINFGTDQTQQNLPKPKK